LILIEYKHVRNLVRKESRLTVQSIQRKVAVSCKNNSKSFWKYIKGKTSVHAGIGDIKVSGGNSADIVIKEDLAKAQAFANHFSNLYILKMIQNSLYYPVFTS